MASIYELQGQPYNALSTFRQGLLLESKNPSITFRAMIYGTLGNIYSKLNKNDSALLYYNLGLKAAKDLESKYDQFEYYKALAAFYEKKGDHKKALEYAKEQAVAKDSIYNTEKSQVISELETKYETEIKEQTILDLEQQNQIKDLEATQDRQLRYGLIILAALLCAVAMLLYNRIKFKQRTSELLDRKNSELQQLNKFKDRLFAVVSHDLKSPLSAFHTLSSSLSSNIERISKEDLASYVEELSRSSKEVYGMLTNLLEWAITQTGHMPFDPQTINCHALVDDVVQQLSATARMKQLSVKNDVHPQLQAFGDEGMVEIIIRNLKVNALKFTPEGGGINISATAQNESVVFSISDTGIGMRKPDVEKLFQIDGNVQSIGSSAEKGTGIGLLLCKELVVKHGGKIWAESEEGKGSTFYFSLPNAAS
jgi:signal transduction histidine kinase